MVYIITNKEDIIIHISETKDYQNNGNLLVNDGKLAISKHSIKEVYEVEEVPVEVAENKYCYTKERGFYKNENYIEPVNELTEIEKLKLQNESLQEQVTNLELALAEIYENGGN